MAAVGVAGVTSNETATGTPLTVRTAGGLLSTPARVAVMFVEPAATAVARPVLSIVAAFLLLEFQPLAEFTWLVISEEGVVPSKSLYVPVALYCCVAGGVMVIVAGVTAMEVS